MNYIPLDEIKNAWVFRHLSLPIIDSDKAQIKPMSATRAAVLWTSFISKTADHPDFFSSTDWPGNENNWAITGDWETRWEADEPELPEAILNHLAWEENTTVYFCIEKSQVIETQWQVFKRCWKNFLFLSDGSLLLGKKRNEVLQFLPNGQFKAGTKP